MDNTEKASKFISHLINEGLLNLDMEQTKQTISVLSAILNHAEKTAIKDYVTLSELTSDISNKKYDKPVEDSEFISSGPMPR